MWLQQIVSAASARDNDTESSLGERLDDLRSLWLGLRGVVAILIALLTLHLFIAGSSRWQLVVGGIAGSLLSEAFSARARRADSTAQLERYVLGAALALACAAFCVMRAYGGGIGLFAFVILLGAYSPALGGRAMLAFAAAASALVVGDLLLGQPGRDYGEFGLPQEWVLGIRAVVLFFEVSIMAHLATRRLRRANARVQALVADLRVAQERLSLSHRKLERWNDDLNREVQRQTEEIEQRANRTTLLNSVSLALSEAVGEDRPFDEALLLLGRQLDACGVHVYMGPAGESKPTLQCVRIHDHVNVPIPQEVLHAIAEGREPISFGPLSFQAPDGTTVECRYGAVPVVTRGRVSGTLAVAREGAWTEYEEDLAMLATAGRELGAALGHRHEFREALARASRESLLNKVARVLDETVNTQAAFERALQEVVVWTGASEAAVVVRGAESRRLEILTRHSRSDEPPTAEMERLLVSIPPMVLDRADALLIGPRGEVLVSEDVATLGVGSLLVAPLVAHREPAGAVVIVGDGAHQWGTTQREVATRLALQLSARLEADAVVRLQARRISELSGLARIAEVVQSTVDPVRLFRGFARATSEVVPFRAMFVARFDDDRSLLVERLDGEGHAETLQATASDAQHPWMNVRSAMQLTLRDGPAPSFLEDVVSPVVVPMRPKGELLGMIVLDVSEQFDLEQLPLVSQAVSQLALALDSAALYRQATERAARIQVIGNLSRIVASAVDLRDAFDAFAEEVRWLMPFDRAVMFRIDGAAGRVEPYAACPAEGFTPQAECDLVSSLAWRAYLAHQPVLVRRDDPASTGGDWSAFDDANEVAMVPVLRGDECIAMFALAHSGGDRYTQGDIDALQEVGRLLAVSIERVELFQQAEHSARHDVLTGLANARYLQEQLDALHLGEPGVVCSLLMLDMDNLKVFNDTLGHAAGDEVIQIVGEAVRNAARAEDFVARLGGDEFVVLMPETDSEGAQALATRIHEALRGTQAHIEGAPAEVRVSIGLASAPDDGTSADELMQAADVAMYTAKFTGGGRSAVASGQAPSRLTRGHRARPERLVDNVVHAATATAAPREREGIALAQRYALATARRMGVPMHESEVLRMLVARLAARRLADARAGTDQTLAFLILEGLASEWAGRDPQSAALAQVVVETAVSLAWLQLPAPFGSGVSLSEASGLLGETRRFALDTTVLQEMMVALRDEADGLRLRAA